MVTDRDYFIGELKNEKEFNPSPITYSRGLSWLKSFLLQGLMEARHLELVASTSSVGWKTQFARSPGTP